MKTHDDVRQAFDNGTVVNASKEELEQLLLAVGRARVLDPANQARSAEMGETMRQLLAARQSESMHTQALSVARIALMGFCFGTSCIACGGTCCARNCRSNKLAYSCVKFFGSKETCQR
jgi:hypothetical protein